MPIPIDQFEKGLGTDQLKIIKLLHSNLDKAYTATELTIAIGKTTAASTALERIAAQIELIEQLRKLEVKGLIRSKNVGNDVYYAFAPKGKGAKA